jgi:hypothetical protein
VNPTGGQIGEGEGIGVAVFLTRFFFFTGFLVGFLVVVETADALGVEVGLLVAGFAVEVGFGEGFGVAATALGATKAVQINIETNNLTFTLGSI